MKVLEAGLPVWTLPGLYGGMSVMIQFCGSVQISESVQFSESVQMCESLVANRLHVP